MSGDMWPYHPELLATAVPRYTSYPTAAEFDTGVGPAELGAALEAAGGDISLYVHIPFCGEICWYCGCNTGRANRRQRLGSYLEALHREVALVGRRLPASARVRRIAFGGGSPNAIAPTDFVRLIVALTQSFRLDEPVLSIELDPRTLTPPWGEVLRRIGVTRASLGVQTFDPGVQRAIGRNQPVEQVERCTTLLRAAGVTSLNYDLMYGLPEQDAESLFATLQRAAELGADRIALFGYAHVPQLIPRQRRIDASRLPGNAERFALAALGHQQLVAAGYMPVGFDHFARPGDPLAAAAGSGRLRRNFQGFTDDDAPVLIGLGASSIGSFPDLLVQNEKNAGRYRMMLSQDRLPAARGVCRSPEERVIGKVIEALLCDGSAVLDPRLLAPAEPLLAPFARRGLAKLHGDRLVILPAGLPYARSIAAIFDARLNKSARQFSLAV